MQVFTPAIFACLDQTIRHDVREKGEFQLTSAQALLAAHFSSSSHQRGLY
jgi:UTP-glucose-1-phosphate uridylyltransferase